MAATNLPRVPDGLRDLMKAYTKEVLREKPTNLYEFSADYFERLSGKKVPQKVLKYEPPQSYEIIMKNRIRQQIPISLVFSIIPDNLTELIKKFIKAVLREKPENLLLFAVEYFQRLKESTHSPRLEYTKYSAYEKYVNEKENSISTQEKCTCGRILSGKATKLEATTEKETEGQRVSLEATHSVQYLRAVCVIQKHMRIYLKEKREKSGKLKSESKEPHKSEDYMNAIFLIQRQFRRYLAKKRAEGIIELKKKNQYDSVEYMNAIRIIQRYCRHYLRKRSTKRPLNSHKTPLTERKFSLTTAAFIIQRAFRNMVKSRRAKKHINAELDQCDEVNDNASEAASYTSASTALLSTESVCEHTEFGGNVYEEGVHQQTIREDEEVENDNTFHLQSDYINEAIKSKGKSINSNGSDSDMDNRKKRGLYGQRSRRDIKSEPSIEKSIASIGNSENSGDLESKVVNKSFNSMEKATNKSADSLSTLDAENEDGKSVVIEEAIKKSISHSESSEKGPVSREQSLEKQIYDNPSEANQMGTKVDVIKTLGTQKDGNENDTETTIKESFSQEGNLTLAEQPNVLAELASYSIKNTADKSKPSEESLEKSTSKSADLEAISQSSELVKATSEQEPIKESISQSDDLESAPQSSSLVTSSTEENPNLLKDESLEKSTSKSTDLEATSQSSELLKATSEDEPVKESISQSDDLESAPQPGSLVTSSTEGNTNAAKQLKDSEDSIKKSTNHSQDLEAAALTQSKNSSEEIKNDEDMSKASEKLDIDAQIISVAEKQPSLDTSNSNNENLPASNDTAITEAVAKPVSEEVNKDVVSPKQQSISAVSVEDTTVETAKENPVNSTEKDEKDLLGTDADEPDKPILDKDYSTEVNSLQTVLNTMKENYNKDEAKLDKKETSTENEESLELSQGALATDNAEKIIDAEKAETVNSDQQSAVLAKINSTDSLVESKESETAEDSKLVSVDASPTSEEPEAYKLNETHSITTTDTEESPNADIGTSIIIQSVLPGEQDYVLPLSSDVPVSSESNGKEIDAVNQNLDKNNTLEEQKLLNTNDKPITNETDENQTEVLESAASQLVTPTKDIEAVEKGNESSEIIKEDSSLETKDKVLGDSDIAISHTEIIKDYAADKLEKLKEQLESNISKSSGEPSLEDINLEKAQSPSEEKKETKSALQSRSTSGSSGKNGSAEIMAETTTETGNIKTSLDENLDDAENKNLSSSEHILENKSESLDEIKSAEDLKALKHSESQPKIKIEHSEDEEQIDKNENIDENSAESVPKILEDTKVSPAVEQQQEIKNDEMEMAAATATDAKETLLISTKEDPVQDETLTNISTEAEATAANKIKTEIEENMEEKKNVLNNASQAKSNEVSEPQFSNESQEKPLKLSDDKVTPKIIETLLEETATVPKIVSEDKEIQDKDKTVQDLEETKDEEATKNVAEESEQETEAGEVTNLSQDDKNQDDSNAKSSKVAEKQSTISTESKLSNESVEEKKDISEIPSTKESEGKSEANSDATEEEHLIVNKTTSSEFDESKTVEKEDTIPKISIDESQTDAEVEAALSKDAVDSKDENQQKVVEKEQITEAVKAEAENVDSVEVKPDSQTATAESKSSLLLSNQLTDTQIKKMPNAKDKPVTSFTSGRLTNVPVAELQLKSFKTDSDGGNWYDVYNEPAEEEIQIIKSNKDTKLETVNWQRSESIEMPERRPNYVYGEESAAQETVKPKQSVAFFISFDGDDGKASFKIPKRFLRETSETSKTSKRKADQVLSMDPVIPAEDDPSESDIEMGYQQFGVQKLQTIHELNENESSNELRSLLDKSNEKVNELDDQEEVEVVEDKVAKIEIKQVEANKNSKVNTEVEEDNEIDPHQEFKRKRSAQIIQRAFKNYKTRQEEKQNTLVEEDKQKLINQNLAAVKIQKIVRGFLARAAHKSKETQVKKYSNIEILAAIRIQNMFRNYIRRKQMTKSEDISKATSATSLVTIIPNPNDSEATEVSLNDGELSEETSMTNSEVNSTKPEWFVGTQRISLDRAESVVASTETGTIGLTEFTDKTQIESDTKLATDIGNITNELNASKVFAQDNGASNNSAGSTNETLEDLVVAAFGELDASYKETTSTRHILNEFLIKEIEFSSIQLYSNSTLQAVVEETCIKKSVSQSDLSEEETKEAEVQDAMDEATSKLTKPDEVIEKMSKRRSSESLEKLKEDVQISEPLFEEPIIRSMSLLQEQSSLDLEDGDIIVYKRLQSAETRESSAQSESVVFGNDDDDEKLLANEAETARTQLARHYTIAGDDPRAMFRSVTIDETVRYIESDNYDDNDNGMNRMSFCLDDETSENIRKKMMAYSLSEGDSDYYDPSKITPDDFHIDTAMTDNLDTSTETESTIVSAATKIQAGARGFLARRRLRRASATKSSTMDTKASFGNDAISESLERFIEEEAARKIQGAYRLHSKKQKKQTNNLKSASLESSLAAKRQMLQRGDALRNDSNSTPEDESSSSTSVGQISKDVDTKSSKDNEDDSSSSTSAGQLSKDMDTKSSNDNAEDERSSSTSVGKLSKDVETKSSNENEADESNSNTSVGKLSIDVDTKSSKDKEDKDSNTASVGQLSKDVKSKSSKDNAEDEISISNSVGQLSKDVETKSSKDFEDDSNSHTSVGQLPNESSMKSSKDKATRSKRSTDLSLKWPAVRQNSMPVQIDCEVLRLIPKHMRRRIKSAENGKKKNRK